MVFCTDPGIPLYGPSGASAHLRGVVAGLRALGHAVTIAVPREADGRGRFGEPVEVPVITAPPRAWPRGVRTFGRQRDRERLARRAWRAGPFDLVWERSSRRGPEGARLARWLRARHLLEVDAPLALEQGPDPGEAGRLRRADRVIAVSPWLVRYAERAGAREVRCVPNGSACRPTDRPPARRERGWTGPVMAHHGSLQRWHGLEALLPVLEALPDWRLAVAGIGPVPRHPRIEAHGHLDGAALDGWLSAAEVAVAPYPAEAPAWFDPLKIRDARAVGLPVLGSVHPACAAADRRVPLGDVEGWARALRALAGVPREPRPRPWSAVCAEALDGL